MALHRKGGGRRRYGSSRIIRVIHLSPKDRSFRNQRTMAMTVVVTFVDPDRSFVNKDLSTIIPDRSFVDKDLPFVNKDRSFVNKDLPFVDQEG
jgi:hypothetical protein